MARLHVLADRYVRKHLEPKGRVLRAGRASRRARRLDHRREARVRKLVTEHLENTLGDLRDVLRVSSAARNAKAPTRRPARKAARS